MALGTSLFLIAVGAILAFAVTYVVEGVDLVAIGVILMIVGGIGLLLSLLFWSSFAPYGSARRTTVVEEEPPHRHHRDTL